MDSEELLAQLNAFDHLQRLRIIEALEGGRVHVSELARRLGLSRPLLYMHLDRLEKANVVKSSLELGESGRAMKYFELEPFELRLTVTEIARAVRADQEKSVLETSQNDDSPNDKETPQ